MTRETILEAIRSEAVLNGGQPLGRARFLARTGIRESYWSGVYWTKWSDALRDAGLEPNAFQGAHDKDTKLRSFLALAHRLGHLPTISEMRFEKRRDSEFPNSKALYSERGGRLALLRDAKALCHAEQEFTECLTFFRDIDEPQKLAEIVDTNPARRGYVYLIRSGRHCKIGITEALYRRAAQIATAHLKEPKFCIPL